MHHIIAITNQKGGCGKTTTATNLAQALALNDWKVLLVDLDPQGNATQGLGVQLDTIQYSVAELIMDRELSIEKAIYSKAGVDLITANPILARTEREMVGLTNSELRLASKLRSIQDLYSVILIDTPPTFGPLMNSALNAATDLIIPVDCGYYAMMGIKELLTEVEEIQSATNPKLRVLGYLLTLFDHTNMANQTFDGLVTSFGELVFETKIRRTVRLKEAPAFGRTVFHHAPGSPAVEDYLNLCEEVMSRLQMDIPMPQGLKLVSAGGIHE